MFFYYHQDCGKVGLTIQQSKKANTAKWFWVSCKGSKYCNCLTNYCCIFTAGGTLRTFSFMWPSPWWWRYRGAAERMWLIKGTLDSKRLKTTVLMGLLLHMIYKPGERFHIGLYYDYELYNDDIRCRGDFWVGFTLKLDRVRQLPQADDFQSWKASKWLDSYCIISIFLMP